MGEPAKRKRRWCQFSLRTLFVIVTVLAVAAAWFFAATTYTASALIHIAEDDQRLAFKIDDPAPSFASYKATQMQLLKSEFVLTAALRKVPNLEIPKRKKDPVRWLADSLQIENPESAEVVRVSLALPEKSEAVALLRAVVDAYMTEVVDRERRHYDERLTELDHVYTEKETELRVKRTELKKLAEQLGTGDDDAGRVRQQMTDLTQSAVESRRAEMLAELQIARQDHKLAGLTESSADFKAAKAERDLAEVDRKYWGDKLKALTEEIKALHSQASGNAPASIDIDALRDEIESLRDIVRDLNRKRQILHVESSAQSRIRVFQNAQ